MFVLLSIFRHHVIVRSVVLLTVLQVVNLSVDVAATSEFGRPEDTAINEIESFVEFILEELFMVEDAVGEEDDHDQDKTIHSLMVGLPSEPTHIQKSLFIIQDAGQYSLYTDAMSGVKPAATTPPPRVFYA